MVTDNDVEGTIPSVICPVCDRLHSEGQPCPRRIATAFVSAHQIALEALTAADKEWIANHSLHTIDIVEKAIIDLM